MLLPVEEVGTSDMATVAVAAVAGVVVVVVVVAAAAVVVVAGGVSGNKVMADPAGHDLEVAGLEEVDLLVVVVVVAAVAVVVVVVVGGFLAAASAAVGFVVVVAALVQGVVGSQAGPEGPADFGDLVPAAVEAAAAAGEGRRVAVLAETVGAGYREVDLEQDRGDLGIVGRGVPAARAGQEAVKGGPAGGRAFQSCPVVGQYMEAAADQGEEGGHAGHSSPGSAGRSHPAPVVHRLTSRHENRKIGQIENSSP